jgi:hypothetical protein
MQIGEKANDRAGQHSADDFVYRQFLATLSVPVEFSPQDFAVAE